ncbi:hypothetical protein FB45DRAFT_931979 [Roridomyces roridus]|uniref:MYND-type domain-containing protein n=1 Tax=Roridomyces roridus TaxID=1738132 RepID=A0AAD7BEL2_9AGAR|nr:hypothetical protein FB45DRAFT_931979 [Roridomyces roridus]
MARKTHLKALPANDVGADLEVFAQLIGLSRKHSSQPEELVLQVSRLLGIPDCNTSRGLKQCHAELDTISSTLDKVYVRTRLFSVASESADRLAAVVIAIYGRMRFDNILRKRVFYETHFLEKATSLLHSPSAREIVMKTLSEMTHCKDTKISTDLSRFAPTILDCLESNLDHLKFVEKAVCVLAHSIGELCGSDDVSPDPEIVQIFPRVLRTLLSVVRLPTCTSVIFGHFVGFCSQTSLHQASVFLATPDSLDFLVACSRSSDIRTRVFSQRSLIDLYSTLESNQAEQTIPLASAPASVRQALQGVSESEDTKFKKEYAAFMQLGNTFLTEPQHSHLDLGRQLVDQILCNEGLVRECLAKTGLCRDMLPACEAALRSSGADVKADMLHLQGLLCGKKWEEASQFSRRCIKRNPTEGFFYYVLAAGGQMGIRSILFADKALRKCRPMSYTIRNSCHYLVSCASHGIIVTMAHGLSGCVRELHGLMDKAAANTRDFLATAQPDHTHLPVMTAYSSFLDFISKGHTLGEGGFKSAEERFSLACDLARCSPLGFLPDKACLALEQIFTRMPNGWEKWGPAISKHLARQYRVPPIEDDALTAWMENLDPLSESDSESFYFRIRGVNPGEERYGPAQLRCCAMCNTASVKLKQCAGCGKTRYCNDACQKKHWKVYREECKASRATE